MDRAGAGGGDARADLPGELGVRTRHERGHLLVPGLDELRVIADVLERAQERVDPITGISIDAVDSPLARSLLFVKGDVRHLASSALINVVVIPNQRCA